MEGPGIKNSTLLTLDAGINLALGIPLIFFPVSVTTALGIPVPDKPFYASILGAVLAGIGLALLLEGLWPAAGMVGLGLGGAIAINICGAGVLAAWLLVGDLDIPLRGLIFLWAVAVVVSGISIIELRAHFKRENPGGNT